MTRCSSPFDKCGELKGLTNLGTSNTQPRTAMENAVRGRDGCPGSRSKRLGRV